MVEAASIGLIFLLIKCFPKSIKVKNIQQVPLHTTSQHHTPKSGDRALPASTLPKGY